MECLDLEQIEEFASDGLDESRRRLIEDHVSSCAACRQRLNEVRENLHVARRVAAPDNADHETVIAHNSQPASRSGDVFLPPDSFPGYQIVREVSRGGQGVVYQAIQQSTRRKVAIKVLRERHFADASERARFEREVQILGQLKHPNIVSIYDSGHVGGNAFYVMDYISGKPLDEYVQAQTHEGTEARSGGSKRSRAQGIDNVLRLFAKVCDAVHAAHLKGIIHRDLKPSNIRVDTEGEPHILDFGLAKLAGAPELSESPAMTMTGQFLGSLPWSSPEQAEGQPSKIDIRTDVYSLGVILYQLLTGRFPYDVVGNMRDVLDRILRAAPTRPSTVRLAAGVAAGHIDDETETIVLKCLAKERDRRYQSAGELARDIGHYLASEPIEAKRDSAWYVLKKTARRYRSHVMIGASFIAVLVVFGIYAWIEALRFQAVARDERAARERATAAEQLATHHLTDMTAAREDERTARLNAQRQAYSANILAADLAIQSDDFTDARRRLAACAESLRGWEWNWLALQSDTSIAASSEGRQCDRIALDAAGTRLYGWGVGQPLVVWNADTVDVFPTTSRSTDSASARGPLSVSLESMRSLWRKPSDHASDSREETLSVHEVQTGQSIQTFANLGFGLRAELSPNGHRLLTNEQVVTEPSTRVLRLWDVETGQQMWEHREDMSLHEFSPDSRWIAGYSLGIEVRDADSGEILWKDAALGVRAVAFDPDGAKLACAEQSGTITVFESATGVALRRHATRHRTPATCVSFGQDCRLAAAWPNVVFLWDGERGQPLRFSGHARLASHVAFGRDGRFYGAAFDGVRAWDIDRPVRRSLLFPSDAIAAIGSWLTFDRAGETVTWGNGRQTVVIDMNSRAFSIAPRSSHTSAGEVRSILARSPDGTRQLDRMMVMGRSRQAPRFLLTGEDDVLIAELGLGPRSLGPKQAMFSSDSRRLAYSLARTESEPAGVRIHDASDGRLLSEYQTGGYGSSPLAVNSTGTCVAVGIFRKPGVAGPGVILIDVDSGSIRRELMETDQDVSCMAFSPDDRYIATGMRDMIGVWDAASGEHVATLQGNETLVRALAFSGMRIASGGSDGTIRVWDAVTFECLLTIREHEGAISDLCFSPDGCWLASVGEDGLRLFDGRTVSEVQVERDSVASRADRYVTGLLDREVLTKAALAVVRADQGIPSLLKDAAISLLEREPDDPERLNAHSWAIVKYPALERDPYRRALRAARAATQLEPQNGSYLKTRGVAEFRMGLFREALESLTHSEYLNRSNFGDSEGGHPTTVAFIAMSQRRLGLKDEAQDSLVRLRELAQQPRWQRDMEAQLFLREADLQISAYPLTQPSREAGSVPKP